MKVSGLFKSILFLGCSEATVTQPSSVKFFVDHWLLILDDKAVKDKPITGVCRSSRLLRDKCWKTETEKDEVLTFYWPVLQFYYDTHRKKKRCSCLYWWLQKYNLMKKHVNCHQSLMHANKLLHHNLFVIVVLAGLKQSRPILSNDSREIKIHTRTGLLTGFSNPLGRLWITLSWFSTCSAYVDRQRSADLSWSVDCPHHTERFL